MNDPIQPPKTTGHLQTLQKMAKGEFPPPGVAKLVGFELKAVDLGHSVFEMTAGPQHANPMGTLHGGIICDIADGAMGCAMATTLEDGESFTTLDLTTKFFKPIWNARIIATAHVTKRTRQLGLIECDVRDEKGSLVAKVYSSCMVLRGDEAKGR